MAALSQAWQACFETAGRLGLRDLAFPLLGESGRGFPAQVAALAGLSEIAGQVRGGWPGKLNLVCKDEYQASLLESLPGGEPDRGTGRPPLVA